MTWPSGASTTASGRARTPACRTTVCAGSNTIGNSEPVDSASARVVSARAGVSQHTARNKKPRGLKRAASFAVARAAVADSGWSSLQKSRTIARCADHSCAVWSWPRASRRAKSLTGPARTCAIDSKAGSILGASPKRRSATAIATTAGIASRASTAIRLRTVRRRDAETHREARHHWPWCD